MLQQAWKGNWALDDEDFDGLFADEDSDRLGDIASE